MADEVKSLKTRKKGDEICLLSWSPGSSVLPLCKMLTEVALDEIWWVLGSVHF